MGENNTVKRKRLLYKTRVDYQIGLDGQPINDYALNHVQGCSHGCKYPCYALGTALKSGNVESYEDWCNPKLVPNAMELLERELKTKQDIKRVHLCFTTDPFPYPDTERADELFEKNVLIGEQSIKIIEKLNAADIPVTVLSKGRLPLLEYGHLRYMFRAIDEPHPDNYYGISLVSLNETFREEWEPNTAPYEMRIESLRHLHKAGCKTWVSMEPFPALSRLLSEKDLKNYRDAEKMRDLGWMLGDRAVYNVYNHQCKQVDDNPHYPLIACLEAVKFVDRIVFGRWNYNKNMPTDVENPDEWYAEAAKIVREFCAKHNIECVIKKGTE